MILCYAASALYHAITLSDPVVAAMKLVDHSGVYLLIAGTDSPVLFFLLKPGRLRRYLLWAAWGLAILGIWSTWFLQWLPYWAIVLPYIALGWVALIPFPILLRAVRWHKVSWLLVGGIFYTLGAVIDWLGPARENGQAYGAHEAFHLLTMLGTFCHVVFVWRFVILYASTHPKGETSCAGPKKGVG